MMDEVDETAMGEAVSALSIFEPKALDELRINYPEYDIQLRRGATLGDGEWPNALSCAVALRMLGIYGSAAVVIQRKLRRRLRLGWWLDLAMKLAATAGAGGALSAFDGVISAKLEIYGSLLAFIGGICGTVFSFLNRDEAERSLGNTYNKLITAMVQATQVQMRLTALCPNGKGPQLRAELAKAESLCRFLNECWIRYGSGELQG